MLPSPSSHAAAPDHTSDTLRPPADSSTRDAQSSLESGIPPARISQQSLAARGEAHAQAALAACARAEANLGSLRRTLQHLAEAVVSAEQSQEDVVTELDQLRRLLAQGDEEQLGLRHRVAVLEQTLERSERENARERAYLQDQQDLFIGGLWDEHEQEKSDYRRRLAASESAARLSQEESRSLGEALRAAREGMSESHQRLRLAEGELSRLASSEQALRETIARGQLDREEAEAVALFANRERDALRAELQRLKAPSSAGRITSIREPQSDSPRFTPVGAIPLVSRPEARLSRTDWEANEVPTERGPQSVYRSGSSPASRPDSSSEPGRQGVSEAPAPASEAPSTARVYSSVIRQKPDASTRPLIGYSLSADDVPEERFDAPIPHSRPPR